MEVTRGKFLHDFRNAKNGMDDVPRPYTIDLCCGTDRRSTPSASGWDGLGHLGPPPLHTAERTSFLGISRRSQAVPMYPAAARGDRSNVFQDVLSLPAAAADLAVRFGG